ncbi:hypothetical protein ACLKA7_000241 [Drosophila subpalustris]
MSKTQLPVDCVGHKGNVVNLAYSKVCSSGYYLASACHDGQAMLRHGDTGDWVGTFEKDGEAMLSVDINQDATRLVTGGDDCTARIWDAVDGKHLSKIMLSSPVRCVALASQSQTLAVGCLDRQQGHKSDDMLYIYSLDNPGLPQIFQGLSRGLRDVIFCREDRALLSSSHDRTIRLWDLVSEKQAHSITLPHHAKSMELCADGRTVTIAYGHSVVFLDVERFEVLQHRKLPGRVLGASLHPEKESFVCAASNNYIYKCDYSTDEILDSFVAHNEKMRCIKYSPDGEVFATSTDNGGLRLWQQNVGKKYALWDTQTDDAQDPEDANQGDEIVDGNEQH